MYKIKYWYETGNTFGREDDEGILEYDWTKIEVAKENLKRIEEHYKYYEATYDGRYIRSQDDKKRIESIKDNSKDKGWYVAGNSCCLKLIGDSGEEWQIWAPWCGYFESLYGAEIITIEEGMKISFGYTSRMT